MTTDKKIGEIVPIGRAAYQLYSHTYRGKVEYQARIGKPWKDKGTGEWHVLPFMVDDSTRDYEAAAAAAARELEQLRAAAFRHDVHQSAAATTPLDPLSETELAEQVPGTLRLATNDS